MVVIYSDYSRARIGHFFGLSGWQLAVVTLSLMPVFVAVNAGAWVPAAGFTLAWALVVVVTVTPVRGRSATNWAATSVAFAIGTLTGWTRFRSRAAAGSAAELHVSDLPGVLAGVEIHDGPPQGPTGRRVAVVQDHTTRTWAVTASVVHPGIGMSEADERARFGTGLSELLDLASRTELVDEILLLVRTVPEDGRDQWLRRPGPDGPTVARVVGDSAADQRCRSVHHPRGARVPPRQGREGGRRWGRGPRPGPVLADGRVRRPAARGGRDDNSGVADLPPARGRVPHRVRPRRPGRDHRRPDRPHH